MAAPKRRTEAEIAADLAEATAKPKEQVISEHISQANGAVPLITPGDGDPVVTAGDERPEDETVWGELMCADGQFHQEVFTASGDINGRKFHRTQELVTGVRCRVFKVLLPSIEFPQLEEIRISTANLETEQALAGNMAPANLKCKAMGCQRVELRGRGLVFIRHQRKYRFIPETGPLVRL